MKAMTQRRKQKIAKKKEAKMKAMTQRRKQK